jgi:hypothetical protein
MTGKGRGKEKGKKRKIKKLKAHFEVTQKEPIQKFQQGGFNPLPSIASRVIRRELRKS